MARFVTGTIIEMQGAYGIYYELELRLQNNTTMPIFYNRPRTERQEDDAISPLLALNESYNLLIIARVRKITYASVVPEGTVFVIGVTEFPISDGDPVIRHDVTQGKVVDIKWSPSVLSYRAISTPKIFERRYMLVETAIGQMVISWQIVEEQLGVQADQLEPGGYLQWSPARLDILAIL